MERRVEASVKELQKICGDVSERLLHDRISTPVDVISKTLQQATNTVDAIFELALDSSKLEPRMQLFAVLMVFSVWR
jgi:hypothetical protein